MIVDRGSETSSRGRRVALVMGVVVIAALVAAAMSSRADGPIGDPGAYAGRSYPPSGTTDNVAPGTYCDSCPDPLVNTFGVEFRKGQMWVMSFEGTLSRLNGCQIVQNVSVQGFRGVATSLGYDSHRDQFIVADAKLEQIDIIDMLGQVVRSFPAPGSGTTGATYDSTRDAIWITDFETDSLYAIAALDGARIASYKLPAATYSAGAAYDRVMDAVYYEDRTANARCYYVSCMNGQLLGSFPLAYGFLAWEDNALAPDGSLWIHNYAAGQLYCVDRSTTPARRTSWGELKNKYR
jgi:streptogramin lyase